MSESEALAVPPSDEALPLKSAPKDSSEYRNTEYSDGETGERPVREKLKKTSIAGLSQQASEIGADQTAELPRTGDLEASNTAIDNSQRGRPAKKRSFEDLQQGEPQNESVGNDTELPSTQSLHKRMRSRDVSAGKALNTNGKDPVKPDVVIHEENHARSDSSARNSQNEEPSMAETTASDREALENGFQGHTEGILSPRKKRSRDQFDKDLKVEGNGSDAATDSVADLGSHVPDASEQLKNVPRSVGGEPEKKRHRDASSERGNDRGADEVKPSVS